MEKIINVGGRLHNPVVGGALTGADEIKDDLKGKMQSVINQETDAALVQIDEGKQDKLTFDQTPTENSTNPVTSGGVYDADAALQQAIEAILLLIPSAASALNQLADKSFVNSSIATATATFRGTYNLVTDLELTVSATHQQIATALASVVSTADNNDYCFVQIPVSDQSTDIRVTERYKFDGTSWEYEYDLNNSGFTADQWCAINSGITSVLVGKLGGLPTAQQLATMFAGKQNTLTFDNSPVAGSDNPVKSSGLYNAFAVINAMIPEGADANNKLVAESRLVAYVTTLINALDATFDVTSANGHVTLRMTQADGVITSMQVLTSDIASDAALTLLGSRVSAAESDIDALQDAYAALTQSDVVIVNGALPSSGQQQNIIYRQPDQDHTPPQYYSDYMWNGTTWVLMATYNNAIDPRPKNGSQNLVTSGGVFDNMGALDVSELNATENPHTLATYADLSAALAAIPSDYQKGGMSIKFVQSSDNKYVQYRYMGTAVTGNPNPFLDVDNWEGIDDLPVIESPNLVRSGGVSKEIGIEINGSSILLSGTWMPDQGNWYQDYTGMHATPKIICYGKKPYISGASADYCCGWKQDGTFLGVENIYQSLDWSQVYEFAFCFVDANNPNGYSDLHVTTGMKKDIDNLYAEDVTLNDKVAQAYYNTGIYLKGSSELLGGYWHPKNGAYVSSGDWKSTPKLICDGNKPYIEGVISNYFCGWKKDGTFLGIENRYQSLDWSQVYEFTHNFVIADNPIGFDNLRVVTEIGQTVIDTQDNVNVTYTGANQLLNGAWMPDTGAYNASLSGYKCTPRYKCNGIEPNISGAKWRLLMRYDSNGNYIGFNDYGEKIDWESATWFSVDFEIQENPNGFNNLVIICGLKGESKIHGNKISELELKDFYSETICCDGDSLTYGTLGISQTDDQAEHNYPSVLQSHLGSKFHIINCGMPGAQSTTILGNATGYRIRTPFTIPAIKNTRVAFKAAPFRNVDGLSNVYCYGPWFSQGLEAMCNPAYIGDVKVKLVPQTTIAPDTEEYSQLIRYEDGDAFDVKEGDILLTNEALSNVKTMAHHIIFMGQNGGWVKEGESIHSTDSINELVSQYKNLIKASNVLYICISSHKWNSSSDTGAWEGETIFANEFGIHYINLRKYMAEDAIQDAIDRGYLPDDGTYPTSADSTAMANGQCPPSLLHDVEGDRIHFTDVGYHLFGDLVYNKFKELYKARILGTL